MLLQVLLLPSMPAREHVVVFVCSSTTKSMTAKLFGVYLRRPRPYHMTPVSFRTYHAGDHTVHVLGPRNTRRNATQVASSPPPGRVNVVGDLSYEPRLAGEREDGGGGGDGDRNFLHCINLVRKQDDPTVRRGAVVKAMCVCSRYNYIEVSFVVGV